MTGQSDRPGRIGIVESLASRAAALTVGEVLREQARRRPEAPAIVEGERELTYAQFNERVNRLAHLLAGVGVARGDRVAVLSENRCEYLELIYACAKLGAILAAQNWRLADGELDHCIRLIEPRLAVVSPRFAETLRRIDHGVPHLLELGEAFERHLADSDAAEPDIDCEAEDGLLILYTSGTTGFPKGALISHRAELARMALAHIDFGLNPEESFVVWAPMFHMASTDQAISVLSVGGKVHVVDGLDPARLVDIVARERVWWLVLLPGMVDRIIAELKERKVTPKGVRLCGAMADLVPLHQIAEVSRLLGAPYVNTFGATETGLAPASKGLIPPGTVPDSLAKTPVTTFTYRLVDAEDREVPDGTPGEMALRGPLLFSGYWNNRAVNEEDFRGGWFHMGDMFIRRPDGRLDFVDRLKYLIKSGGENVYPAEIERVLLAEPRVQDAVVVRQPDDKWGEVPVAFVVRNDEGLTADALEERCRRELAGYKRPKEIRFVPFESLPRSTTGKIQRHEVEKWLAPQGDR